MLILAWANLTHRKVRSTLSVLAVAIAIALLLILVGLSHGTLNEVSARMQSVQAEIVVRDRNFDLGSMSGGKLWEKEIERIAALTLEQRPAVERVLPVFLGRMKLGGLSQNVFGVSPEDFRYFAGPRKLVAGTVFTDTPEPQPPSDPRAGPGAALPLVIDQRLSHAAALTAGATTSFGDSPAVVTGVVETGVAGRVFAPINRLRALHGVNARTAHMFFVKARAGLSTTQLQALCEQIEAATGRQASLVANYGQVLAENYRPLTIFITLVSVIALAICFLFILVTMYTMVLERGKEIAILQSLGAGRVMILRQTLQEALLICSLGTLLGMLLAYGARWLIETIQPLMVVEMRLFWLAGAAAVGLAGGVASALYPAWVALRQDPAAALSFE